MPSRIRRSCGQLAFACIALLSIGGMALAQNNGSITGTVKDPNGAVVPGASVTVSDASQGINESGKTNEVGIFAFVELPPGTYTLIVESQGFKKTDRRDIELPVSSRIDTGDIVLEIGSL